MDSTSFRTALLLVCVGTVIAVTPKPCCAPKQFVIKISEVTTDIVNGTVVTKEVVVDKAYDATNELMTDILREHNLETGTFEETKTIYLFPQAAKYVIKDGTCTKEALSYQFLELCVPAGAKFDESFSIGLGQYAINSFRLTLPQTGYDLVYQFSYGQEKCIPYQCVAKKAASSKRGTVSGSGGPLRLTRPLGVAGFTAGAEGPLSTYAQYTDYIEGIADPASWFKLPAECKKPANQQEAAAKKMAKKLGPMFDGLNRFAVY